MDRAGDIQLVVCAPRAAVDRCGYMGQVCRASGGGGRRRRRGERCPPDPRVVPSTSEALVCFCQLKKRFFSPPVGDGVHAHTHTNAHAHARTPGRLDALIPFPVWTPSHLAGVAKADPEWPPARWESCLCLRPGRCGPWPPPWQPCPGGISHRRAGGAQLPYLFFSGRGISSSYPALVPSPREAPCLKLFKVTVEWLISSHGCDLKGTKMTQ